MKVYLKPPLVEALGKKKLVRFGVSLDSRRWRGDDERTSINLARLDSATIGDLATELEPHRALGAGVVINDIIRWSEAMEGAGSARPRTIQQFEGMLTRYIHQAAKRHWVFSKIGDRWVAYVVTRVKYHPPERHGGDVDPASVSVSLVHEQFGGQQSDSMHFVTGGIKGKTVAEAMAAQGYFPATDELLAIYKVHQDRFQDIAGAENLGRQFLGAGVGTDDVDGNPSGNDDDWTRSYRNETHPLTSPTGEPCRLVMDLFFESRSNQHDDRKIDLREGWWPEALQPTGDDEDDVDLAAATEDDDGAAVQVPLHPWVVVFHLSLHLRLRVHVDQLTDYVYDEEIIHRLILPTVQKDLLRMLVEAKADWYQDIIGGKTGGVVIMLTGPPGTGKTLTAEIYAEQERRALYSVQCAQLGTDPATLEDNLRRVFERASRWKAVMLLDEADVYVAERGTSLEQNAIVGVFLRILEYQTSVLFMTTNRPGDIDDAVSSRCVVRLDIKIPTSEQQTAIWQVLADVGGADLSDETINQIVKRSPGITGRDVKNLLKLAMLKAAGGPITAEDVAFAKRFKPTGDQDQADEEIPF